MIFGNCDFFSPHRALNFSANKRIILVNEEIQLTNLTISNNQFSWDFGDGNQSSEKEPKHVYKSPGQYWIKLSFTKKLSAYKELKMVVLGNGKSQLSQHPDPIPPPSNTISEEIIESEVTISLSSSSVLVGENLKVNCDASEEIIWDFGNERTSESKISHITYNTPGIKTILLLDKNSRIVLNQKEVNVIYKRHFNALGELSLALNQIANPGKSKNQKTELIRKTKEDCLYSGETTVEGANSNLEDYLLKLFIESSPYEKVKVSIQWEIDKNTGKIKKIVVK